MTETFSFSSTISSAWKLMRRYWRFVIPAAVAAAAVMMFFQWLQGITEGRGLSSFFASLIALIFSVAIVVGWSNVSLKLVRGTSGAWNDLKTAPRIWAHYFVAKFLAGIATMAAIILIVTPLFAVIYGQGISWYFLILGIVSIMAGLVLFVWIAIQIFFIPLVAIDHPDASGWKLIKRSRHMAQGRMLDLFGFMVILFLVNILGLLLAVVGLLITVPLSMIAKAYVYDYLKEKSA